MINFLIENNVAWVALVIVIGFIIYYASKFQKEGKNQDLSCQIATIKTVKPLFDGDKPSNDVELVSFEEIKNKIVAKKDLFKPGNRVLYIPSGYRLFYDPAFYEHIRPEGDSKKSKLGKYRTVMPVTFDLLHTGNYNPIVSNGIFISLSDIAKASNEFYGLIDEGCNQYAASYLLMGILKEINGDTEGALSEYKETIRLEPNKYRAYWCLGQLQRNLKLDEWKEQFQKVIEITTAIIRKEYKNSKAFLFRGMSNECLGFVDKAMQDYSHAIEIDSNNHDAYSARAYNKIQFNDYSGTIDDYSKAIECNPENLDDSHLVDYSYRGIAKMRMGDTDGALQDFLKAIEFEPMDDVDDESMYKTYCYICVIHYNRKKYEQGLMYASKALEKYTDFAEIRIIKERLLSMIPHLDEGQITMTTDGNELEIGLLGFGEVIINWGDGNSETHSLMPHSNNEIENNNACICKHIYSEESVHAITIFGKNITYLHCCKNQLTSLNVSGNSTLIELYCFENQLTQLSFKGCNSLTKLSCYGNQLTHLDLIDCQMLNILACAGNQLTQLDLQNCKSLTEIDCYYNQINSLDVSSLMSLTVLNCMENHLTSLDLGNCTSLTELYCMNNQLTQLNVSGCEALIHLACDENLLTQLDLRDCTSLKIVRCMLNKLTQLNLTNCKSLEKLYCAANQLTQLDLSDCTELVDFNSTGNQLIRLDFRNCKSICDIGCGSNKLETNALYELFESLPTKENIDAEIYFMGNPGAKSCDYSILERKNWSIIHDNESDDKEVHTLIGTGIKKSENGDIEGAIEDFEKAIKIQPFSYLAYYFWGLTIGGKQGIKYLNKTIAICTNIVENEPNQTGHALLFRGYAYDVLEFADLALNDFSRVIEINPNQWEAYFKIGDLKLYEYNDPQSALEAFSRGIEINPDDSSVYYKRALAKEKLRDFKGATQDVDKALEICPDFQEARMFKEKIISMLIRGVVDFEQ